MTAPADRVPAFVLVLLGVISVQFGGALAATLVPRIGAAGSVTLRLAFAAVIMLAFCRPQLRGHSASAWRQVVAFGLALALMNFTFYASLAHLPIGVAVTIEFIGPLALATVLSRRVSDLVAVAAAAAGVALISGVFHRNLGDLDWAGVLLALAAGAFWAAYIVFSSRVGASFPRLDGLAIALVISLAVMAPFGVTSIPQWDAQAVTRGLGIAVLSTVLPYSLELLALRRLSSAVFGILLSLEPAVAALAGLLVLSQRLEVHQLAGMALVISASVIVLSRGKAVSEAPAPT